MTTHAEARACLHQRRKEKTASTFIVHAMTYSHDASNRKNESVRLQTYIHRLARMVVCIHWIHAQMKCTHKSDSGAIKEHEAWCMHIHVHVNVCDRLVNMHKASSFMVAIEQGLENAMFYHKSHGCNSQKTRWSCRDRCWIGASYTSRAKHTHA